MSGFGAGLSIILRTHGRSRLPLLDKALFSIAIQRVRDVQVVVAYQGDDIAASDILDIIARQPFETPEIDPRHQIVRVENPDGRDRRAELLNRGVAAAQNRYIAFLDDDDVVYPHGYERLIERLVLTNAAVAAGGTMRADLADVGGRWITRRKFGWVGIGRSQRDLFERNFLPLHSFVIDRARIAAGDLHFNESLTRLEDYDLLLRLAARYPFDMANLDQLVCEYRLRAGADHANPLAGAWMRKDPSWTAARVHIGGLKRELAPAFRTLPRSVEVGRANWWSALRRARLHSGGWFKLGLRLLDNIRMHGPRQVLYEARRLAQRPEAFGSEAQDGRNQPISSSPH